MPQVALNVKLIETTQNPVAVLYSAYRQCYSAEFAADLLREDFKKQEEFVRKMAGSGHESPLEHVKFTFAVEGVSRVLTHQLVRHRIASYSQQSQRYVKEADFDFIIPPSIEEDEELKSRFIETMSRIQTDYNKMLKALIEKGRTHEEANEDARFVLPQAIETKIVVTMNCRELLHFFQERCCARAQWEIRDMAWKMLLICRDHLPAVFGNSGAKCISLGYCPEGERFTCGAYPLKQVMLNRKYTATE